MIEPLAILVVIAFYVAAKLWLQLAVAATVISVIAFWFYPSASQTDNADCCKK